MNSIGACLFPLLVLLGYQNMKYLISFACRYNVIQCLCTHNLRPNSIHSLFVWSQVFVHTDQNVKMTQVKNRNYRLLFDRHFINTSS
jgi:hypothetical protein